MKKDYSTGPFGAYDKGTPGHILNALHHYGIPLHILNHLTIGAEKDDRVVIKDRIGQYFATCKYYENFDRPLFSFKDINYHSLQNHDGDYQLTLWVHDQPSLVLIKNHCKDAYIVINRCLTNYTSDPAYELHMKAGSFFQSGSSEPDSDFYYVNFIHVDKAQLWMDHFNQKLKEHRAAIHASESEKESEKPAVKYSIEAVAYAAFEKAYYGSPDTYQYLRYGQAFHDHFKLDKMNKDQDSRLSLIYQLDGNKAKKLIMQMFDFT